MSPLNTSTLEQRVLIRQQLVAGGLRTVGYSFDGSGDSGSVDHMKLHADPTTPLQEILDANGCLETFNSATIYGYSNGKYQSKTNPAFEKIDPLLDQVTGAENYLEEMAYAALEHFDGDWVNNEGGYGTVAIDLVTGAFYIDGSQRVSSEESACSDGTLKQCEPIDPAGTFDMTSLIKATLGTTPPRSS